MLLITAAHCTHYLNAGDMAVTGDFNRSTLEGAEQVRTVERIIIHENYNPRNYDNDIALVVLRDPLRFDDFTKPINLSPLGLSRKRKLLIVLLLLPK